VTTVAGLLEPYLRAADVGVLPSCRRPEMTKTSRTRCTVLHHYVQRILAGIRGDFARDETKRRGGPLSSASCGLPRLFAL
jgi:hypothetical protein